MKFININVTSMNSENMLPMTICRNWRFSKPSLKIITCTAIRIMLNMKLVVPTLKFVIRLETYGMQISGEVPRFALIESDAPREIMNNDIKYITYLLNFFTLIFIPSTFNLEIFKCFLGKIIT